MREELDLFVARPLNTNVINKREHVMFPINSPQNATSLEFISFGYDQVTHKAI